MKNLFTLLLFVFFLHSARATNYYFSTVSGDDSRTAAQAQNPSTPWKTIGKLNSYFSSLQASDSVLFNRSETFYGSITVNKSGTASSPIVIGAYGTGDKPVITGLTTLTNWVSVGNGIYESYNASLGSNLNLLLLNDEQQPMGRYPNTDYLTLESHSGKTSITDNELSSDPNWTGAELVTRPAHWLLNRSVITSHSGNTLYYSGISEPNNNFGYFIQNSIKTLDQFGEWYYDKAAKKVSVYFGEKSPSSCKVTASAIDYVIYSSNRSYVVVNNLTLKGGNKNTVDINSGNNFQFSNCNVLFSGIDGVNVSNHSYFKIENCAVSNSYNNGISVGTSNPYAIVRNNIIRNSYAVPGMGQSGEGQGAGIRVNKSSIAEYNQVINSGFIGIQMGGDSCIVKNNYIDSFCFVKDDGGGIYTYNNSDVTNYGRKVTGNIVLNGIGAGAGANTTNSSAEGIYMDGLVNGVEIAGNTIANSNKGLFLNNARDVIVKNNTLFNNGHGQLHMQHNIPSGFRNNTITNNIFFSKTSNQPVSAIVSKFDNSDINSLGRLDSNYYARPIDDKTVISNTIYANSSGETLVNLDLEGWKTQSSLDPASKRSAKQISPYTFNSLIGSNKFPYGSFSASTDIKKAFPNSCTLTWGNSGLLDGGYLEVAPSAKSSSIVMGVGTLSANKNYILKYSLKGSSSMSIGAYLRASSTGSYKPLTTNQIRTVSIARSENEMVFTPSQDEANGSVVLFVDAQSSYYLDNIQLFEVEATVTNPDDSIRFVFNPNPVNKIVPLDGKYVDVKNNKYLSSIKLQPYESAILIKDGKAPVVSLAIPAAYTNFASTSSVTFSAAAVDSDGTVSKVDFYNGDTLLGTATASPYTFTWSKAPAGTYFIIAKATDNDSLVATSDAVAVSVYVPNVAPSVSLTSPVANASIGAPASITLSADAADTDGTVKKVQFYNNDTLLGTATVKPYTFTWNNVPKGRYSITAKATDDSSAVTTSTAIAFSVYNPNVAPSVSLTSPVANASIGAPASVTISADAADTDGTVKKVEFYNNGILLGTATTRPYTFTWISVPKGTYSITAKATDDSSAVTTSTAIAFSVYNPNVAPSVSLTSPVANASIGAPASVTISADAADTDGTVKKVEFYNNGILLGTATTRPYTFTWNSVPKGTYFITAKATDDSSAVTTSTAIAFSVYNPNVAPSVSLTSPVANASIGAPASVTISADAADSDGTIKKVEFYNNGVLLGTATTRPYTFTWNSVPKGTYFITAKATDDSLAVNTSTAIAFSVYNPNVAPSVSLTSPVANASIGAPASVVISADAADSDGTVKKVEFYNNDTLIGTASAKPYTFNWSNVKAGNYSITAKAIDDSLAVTASAPVAFSVTVPNIDPTVYQSYDTLSPIADAFVRNGNYSSINYGSDSNLVAKNSASSGYTRASYLKFSLNNLTAVSSAKIRIYGRNSENTSNITISAYSVDNDSWNENTITLNNAPDTSSSALSSTAINNVAAYYEFDVTNYVKAQFAGDKVVSFLVKDASNQNKSIVFNSKENLNNIPQLVVTAPIPDLTVLPIADAYIRDGGYAATNYGNDTSLGVKSTTAAGYGRSTYIKFPLNNAVRVGSAKLRIFGRNTENTATINVSVYNVDNDSWTENTITYNNAPTTSGSALSTTGVNNQARYYDLDVTDYVKTQFAGDKIVTFLVKDSANQNRSLVFNSKENTQNPPQLIIGASDIVKVASKNTAAYNATYKTPTVSQSIANKDTASVINNLHALNVNTANTSVGSAAASTVKVYPNPAVNKIQISVDGIQTNSQKANMSITNLSGMIIKNIPVVLTGKTLEADVTSLTSGMYIVTIAGDDFKISKKFLKN